MEHEPNNINIRVKCSGRIDPQHILFAFKQGADGVLIAGCHPGDCHYQDGNYKTERKVFMLKRVLTDLGISPERLHLEWISASEGKKFAKTVNSFTKKIKSLGPLKL
jgi:F420-non-reducing hydrogenase iron-sulfur subunit